ncbi:MAG: hypothetical protein DDG59_00955 [Anaerolineae bacterium]|jgi:DNA-binding NarL/FixJ family response regulator|nr:MAG: hypothetical protein DDG59_00955 [Anaerolineae bacterium]
MKTNPFENHPIPYQLLIADDHAALRNTLALWIGNLFPQILILEAENGLEAIRICQKNCVDLMLIDLKMPDIDGFQVTQRVREICPHTQIYLMSMIEGEAYQQQAKLAGANGFFSKNTMDTDLPLTLARLICEAV